MRPGSFAQSALCRGWEDRMFVSYFQCVKHFMFTLTGFEASQSQCAMSLLIPILLRWTLRPGAAQMWAIQLNDG